MLINERVLKNIIKQDEDFQKFALGRDIGEEQGIEKTKHDMVIKLYNQKVSLDIIAKASELSESEVKAIIDSAKDSTNE